MAITAAMVKRVKRSSGAGMMDCKEKLLQLPKVIWTKAMEFLREKRTCYCSEKKLAESQLRVSLC